MKSLAVFCGSNHGVDPSFQQGVLSLADTMSASGIALVYGGSKNGLMGRLADRLLEQGGHVTGVMPNELVNWEQSHEKITTLHRVETMAERKALMAELADGFLALPGGIGTVEEISEAISWAQLGIHHKPCGLLNTNRYYDHLLAFFDHSVAQGLMRQKTRDMILVDNDPTRLLQKMQAYRSPVDYHWPT